MTSQQENTSLRVRVMNAVKNVLNRGIWSALTKGIIRCESSLDSTEENLIRDYYNLL